eukprot:jgi/Undpi1/4475/HiC_scaffold_17.g07829.m1
MGGTRNRPSERGCEPEVTDGTVPAWARPSKEEMEDIVENQFGPWRKLSDVAAHNATLHGQPCGQGIVPSRQGLNPSAEAMAAGGGGGWGWGVPQALRGKRQPATPTCPAMKQGMAPVKDEDLSRCYDAAREGYSFGEPLRQVEVVTLGGDRKVKESPLGVVTYMSTSRDEDLNLLRKSLEALSRNFLRRYPYPVAIVNEDFEAEIMKELVGLVPVPVHFVKVAFKLPDWMEPLSWIQPLAIKYFTGHPKAKPLVHHHSEVRGMLPYVKRSSFGYFHMCRFFGGAGFMLPFFDDFDYYLRLDSDSLCDKPMTDYFAKVHDSGADYAFASTFLDFGDKAQGLWNFAEEYIRDNKISPTFWNSPLQAGRGFKALAAAKQRPAYPNCQENIRNKNRNPVSVVDGASIHAVPCEDRHFQAVPAFYTNFEVARIEMFRSSWYQNWFNEIDKTGSIFYNR